MEGVDQAKTNAVILETSRGSRFYQKQVSARLSVLNFLGVWLTLPNIKARQDEQTRQRIATMLAQAAAVRRADMSSALADTDALVARLEGARDFSHTFVHVVCLFALALMRGYSVRSFLCL
jgi:hypothetical protein